MRLKSLSPFFTVVLALVNLSLGMAPLAAQLAPLPYDEGALGLAFALRKLPVTSTFLQVTAHPDDEDNGLLMLLSRGRGARTGLLTLTRGGGGQNEIGPELFEALGILRTEELMSMHRYDATRQFFGRAYDFGYSFDVVETLEKWGKEEILKDVVRVIRTFRPDVITTLSRTGTGGGQHHQASALITEEAFRAAADPARFPEQITEGLRPWQAKKIYERYRSRGSQAGRQEDQLKVLQMETGIYDPLLGKTYYQVGAQGRSFHRCQGMSQMIALPGEHASQWRRFDQVIETDAQERDLFDGIDTTLFAIETYTQGEGENVPFLHHDLLEIQEHIDAAVAAYHPATPENTAPPLARGLRAVRDLRSKIAAARFQAASKFQILFLLDRKEEDFMEALHFARQLSLETLVDDGMVIPGQEFELVATIANGGPTPLDISVIHIDAPPGWLIRSAQKTPRQIPPTAVVNHSFRVTVPAGAELSQPYWQRNPQADRYEAIRAQDPTQPWSPPPVTVRVIFETNGTSSTLESAARYRYEGPWVGGEQRHALMVVPAISLRVNPEINILPLAQADQGHEIRVTTLYNGREPTSGRVQLEVPAGWEVVPQEAPLSFTHENQSVTTRFRIFAPENLSAGDFEIRAVGYFQGQTYQQGYQVIDYHHIQRRLLYHPSTVQVKAVDVQVTPDLNIAYIMGVADKVPEALRQLGVDFTFLGEDDLAFGDLDQYDVIVTGVRAYLNREDLKAYNYRLLDWVKGGGTMIVQYNKYEFNETTQGPDGRRQMLDSPYAPYPAQVGSGRVTDENAPTTILEPAHPVFFTPNEISGRDWEDWVQERGLYFMGEKDPRYRDLLSIQDPFEYNQGVKLGSLVEAEYGQGRWIYVGLGLWRQLPAGVPGAYRLLANLLSLGQ
ncbi:MAG: NEW3 domain-containing protein [Acidobacteria bacterium]|nr:NEW3 domain-containing protein [Acidobacteriota bacterium]